MLFLAVTHDVRKGEGRWVLQVESCPTTIHMLSPKNTILFGDKVTVYVISYNEAIPEECGPLTCSLKNGKFGHRRTYKTPWEDEGRGGVTLL